MQYWGGYGAAAAWRHGMDGDVVAQMLWMAWHGRVDSIPNRVGLWDTIGYNHIVLFVSPSIRASVCIP